MDNLSVVILSFENFTRYLESIEPQQGKVSAQRNRSQTNVLPESISQMSTQKGPADQLHSSQPNIGPLQAQQHPGI